MPLPRSLMPFLSVILLALVLAACGSDGTPDERSGSTGTAGSSTSDDPGADASGEDAPERGPASEERAESAAGGGIAISPAVTACLERAGFTLAPTPPGGAIAAWRAEPDATVAIAPTLKAARALATRLGDVASPASATGRIAAAGPPELRDAGVACLEPAVAQDA